MRTNLNPHSLVPMLSDFDLRGRGGDPTRRSDLRRMDGQDRHASLSTLVDGFPTVPAERKFLLIQQVLDWT
jgi:hypothetical protein